MRPALGVIFKSPAFAWTKYSRDQSKQGEHNAVYSGSGPGSKGRPAKRTGSASGRQWHGLTNPKEPADEDVFPMVSYAGASATDASTFNRPNGIEVVREWDVRVSNE